MIRKDAFKMKPGAVQGVMPPIHTEETTLALALSGFSISRFGDGELRCAMGGQASAQIPDQAMAHELRRILIGPTKSLVCLPHSKYGPKAANWKKYETTKFTPYFKQMQYGSAFITRPDSTPHINTPEYWANVRKLWSNRDTVLVVGTDYGSLNEHMLRDARSLRVVFGPRRDAYAEIPRLMDEIGKPPEDHIVLMCLGPAATIMAERLAQKGVWAIDIGHIGKFMPKEFR